MASEITFTEDILDSRDIQARFDELDEEKDDLQDAITELDEELAGMDEDDEDYKSNKETLEEELIDAEKELEEWIADNEEEYELLKEVVDRFGGYGDWDYGETLIHESYWTEYVKQLLEDTGDIPENLPWYIADNIHWDGVAYDIATDYMSETINGYTYYMRA